MQILVTEAIKKYHLGNNTIYKWIKKGLLQNVNQEISGSQKAVDEEELQQIIKLYWDPTAHRSYDIKWNRCIFRTIDTPEKAYWLGFIVADGCLHLTSKESSAGHFSIDISGRDSTHLLKFLQFIEADGSSLQHTAHSITGNDLVHIQLSCASTNQDLLNLGILPRKSGREAWIDTPYPADFIRGLYDGDGYVKKNLHSIGLVGSYALLQAVQIHFLNTLKIQPKKIGEHGCIYRIEYTSKADKIKIANYVWYDGCVSLDRKQNLINELKKLC